MSEPEPTLKSAMSPSSERQEPGFEDCGCGCTPETKPWPHTMVPGNCARAVRGTPRPVITEEYGGLMSGGGVNVWPDGPELLDIFPLAKRIENGKRFGGHVLRRRVIVIDDWEEI